MVCNLIWRDTQIKAYSWVFSRFAWFTRFTLFERREAVLYFVSKYQLNPELFNFFIKLWSWNREGHELQTCGILIYNTVMYLNVMVGKALKRTF